MLACLSGCNPRNDGGLANGEMTGSEAHRRVLDCNFSELSSRGELPSTRNPFLQPSWLLYFFGSCSFIRVFPTMVQLHLSLFLWGPCPHTMPPDPLAEGMKAFCEVGFYRRRQPSLRFGWLSRTHAEVGGSLSTCLMKAPNTPRIRTPVL